jgi:hypothetical protein
VLNAPYHEILKKQITVEVNNNFLKLATNRGINIVGGANDTNPQTIDADKPTSNFSEVRIEEKERKFQALKPSGQDHNYKETPVAIPSNLIRSENAEKTLKRVGISVPHGDIPFSKGETYCVNNLNYAGSKRPAQASCRKPTSEQQSHNKRPSIAKQNKFVDFYRHLKTHHLLNSDHIRRGDNYKYHLESASTKARRMARLQSILVGFHF